MTFLGFSACVCVFEMMRRGGLGVSLSLSPARSLSPTLFHFSLVCYVSSPPAAAFPPPSLLLLLLHMFTFALSPVGNGGKCHAPIHPGPKSFYAFISLHPYNPQSDAKRCSGLKCHLTGPAAPYHVLLLLVTQYLFLFYYAPTYAHIQTHARFSHILIIILESNKIFS